MTTNNQISNNHKQLTDTLSTFVHTEIRIYTKWSIIIGILLIFCCRTFSCKKRRKNYFILQCNIILE